MHRHNIAIIFISIAGFLVLFIFFINIFNPTTAGLRKPDEVGLPKPASSKSEIYSPQVNFTDPVLGEKTAINTIVVYSDFLCPYSKKAAPILQKLVQDYPERIKIIWKDFPNTSLHPAAILAAQAAHCAREQDKFWLYHDYIFENQEQISPSFLIALADEIKLNKTEFLQCFQNEKMKPKVQNNLNKARALKLDGTPTLFLNGTKYQGQITYEDLEMMIQ